MKNPNIKTKVLHSRKKAAWNIVGTSLGKKHKIARVPYDICNDKESLEFARAEAFEHAEFISYCFNHSASILTNKEKDEI